MVQAKSIVHIFKLIIFDEKKLSYSTNEFHFYNNYNLWQLLLDKIAR